MKQKLTSKTRYTLVWSVLVLGLTLGAHASSAADRNETSAVCLGCHNYGDTSPAQIMLEGKHGKAGNEHSPMAQEGCQTCHGESTPHTKAPTKVAPDISFGPRWIGAIPQQNAPCLQCHENDTAQHWIGNTHAAADVTCVSCHDLHQVHDKILTAPEAQAEACTVCHKVQKQGIHNLTKKLADNPPCTACHNPHANALGLGTIVENRSLGCRQCHNLQTISDIAVVSSKAASYHKTMAQSDRSCVDCHQQIAHAAADNIAAVIPMPLAERKVTLFSPGQSDLDWLLSEHPGSQAFRQGHACQTCHSGDEVAMGKALAGDLKQAALDTNVTFKRKQNTVLMTISWQGSRKDTDVAVMWGASQYDTFRRTGCWAACHNDMKGMSRDHNQGRGKYLDIALAQIQRIGQPDILKTPSELQTLMDNEQFVYMWRVNLNEGQSPTLETGKLLAKLDWVSAAKSQVQATYQKGLWQVTIPLPLAVVNADENTFGIAVHGAERAGAKHWVSLPQTFSLTNTKADFTAQ